MGRSVLDTLRRREQARKGDPESTRAVTAAKAAALAVTATAIATGAYFAWLLTTIGAAREPIDDGSGRRTDRIQCAGGNLKGRHAERRR